MNHLKDKPFVLIGANIMATDPKKLKAVVEKEKLNWLSITSTDAIKAQWNNPGTPSYYVIDHKGVIRHKWVGNPGAPAIDAALDKLIGEAPESGKNALK